MASLVKLDESIERMPNLSRCHFDKNILDACSLSRFFVFTTPVFSLFLLAQKPICQHLAHPSDSHSSAIPGGTAHSTIQACYKTHVQ